MLRPVEIREEANIRIAFGQVQASMQLCIQYSLRVQLEDLRVGRREGIMTGTTAEVRSAADEQRPPGQGSRPVSGSSIELRQD